MAMMVKKIFDNGAFLYKMNLVAGKDGTGNLVQWVHIIEDDAASTFLRGNELVFTAGILNTHKDWLLGFAKKLYEAGASALVVNIGPYTKEISDEVVEYCDKVNLPLFTIPQEIKMVDMSRDFCQMIINHDQVENSIAQTLKNVLFRTGDQESQILQLERYGYKRDSRYSFAAVSINYRNFMELEEYKNFLLFKAEKIAKGIREQFITFSHKDCLVFALADYSDDEIEQFVREFLKAARSGHEEGDLNIGISSNRNGIYNQDKNLEKAFSAMEMAVKKNETVSFYDQLDIYKILYAINDKMMLRGFYNDTISKLEEYDRKKNAGLTLLLKTYLENNGSLQQVAEKLLVHRNTVTNQLKKIESITGYNPMDLEHKVMFYLGFYIKDMI